MLQEIICSSLTYLMDILIRLPIDLTELIMPVQHAKQYISFWLFPRLAAHIKHFFEK